MYKIEKPQLSKIKDEEVLRVLSGSQAQEVFGYVNSINESGYLYWDKMRYKEPSPSGISKETLWKIVKWMRGPREESPITDKDGKKFTWSRLRYFEEFFHKLDMNTGGELFVEQGGLNKAHKQKYITRGIMEEAIASSQLEGAATSRQAAKKMLREGRKPSSPSEQMIANNYHSMKLIEEDYKDRALSIDLILELHSLITKDIKDSQGEKPRMRKKGESISVCDKVTGDIYHEGPDTTFVKKELKKLIAFANGDVKTGQFIHPVVKAIMIHFWIGYLHPFTDGNGRLARLLFYWYLIRYNYWAFAFLPVSKVIKKAPMKYIMSYVYSEQDENDMTYFIDYNMRKIMVAVEEFQSYVQHQAKHNVRMSEKSKSEFSLNVRQVQLLQYFHGNMDEGTTLKTHQSVNQIAKMTASKDLKQLVGLGFLSKEKQGRNVRYSGTDKIKQLFHG